MFISGFVIRIIALVSSQLRWLTATGIREEFYGLLSQIMALSKDICGTVSSLLPRLPPSFSSLAVSNEKRVRVSFCRGRGHKQTHSQATPKGRPARFSHMNNVNV